MKKQRRNIKNRTGIELKVVAITARRRRKRRGVDVSSFKWMDSPLEIAKDPEIDVVVELIGDMDKTARKIIARHLRVAYLL